MFENYQTDQNVDGKNICTWQKSKKQPSKGQNIRHEYNNVLGDTSTKQNKNSWK